jgi:hypothetical protein
MVGHERRKQSLLLGLRHVRCRTVEVEGATFESIPENLFLRASLIAASRSLTVGDGVTSDGRRRSPSGDTDVQCCVIDEHRPPMLPPETVLP